jgi:3-dehydroshikimate dehydratase
MTSIAPGLCSVTFRHLPVHDVIDLAAAAQLAAIEWGADVHVPPGNGTLAEEVRDQCVDRGLACPSYGSYYFAGKSAVDELAPTLETACSLGATTVRVWAPGDPSPEHWDASAPVIDALAHACDAAAELGLTLALEFHPGTLTETARSTREVLADVDRPNLRTYWQPVPGATHLHALTELDPVLRHLAHLHVFSWETDSSRLPLAAHESLWRRVLAKVADQHDDRPACAYLEFVAGDTPEAMMRDAATLRGWLEELA